MTSDADDDSRGLESLEFATCLRCGRGGGDGDEDEDESSKLLVCSEIGCPIGIHKACVSSEREIDSAGKFCCPYCAHKRALVRAEKLRRKAVKAEELLSRFISMSYRVGVTPASEETREEDENQDNAGVGNDGGDEGMEERNLVDEVAPETGDFQGGSPLLRKKRYKRKVQGIPESSPSRKSSSGCKAEALVAENGEERREEDRNDEKGDDESAKLGRNQRLNRQERVTPSGIYLTRVVGSNRKEKDTDYISSELKATNNSSESREILEPSQTEKATGALPKSTTQVRDSNQNVKTGSSAQPVKVQEVGSEEFLYESTKRRRINWTPEELKELKEGVQYFSMQVSKNLPWRKILDRGRHVFHETRTPDNLKDKWKTMCREASNR